MNQNQLCAVEIPSVRRVLIIDDHPVIRQGLRYLLEKTGDLSVCGEAENAKDARAAIDRLNPNVLICDISLRQVDGIERALNEETDCEQVMHLIAGARGAMAGLMAEVVEDHVREHLVDRERHPGALNVDAAEKLLEVIRAYLK